MFLDELSPVFVIIVAVILGLCFGSFLNVVIYRLPREMNLAKPPSTCPGCGKLIRAYDNLPVFGWLFLGGKARCCKAPISVRYPLVELLGGLLAWGVVETKLLPNHDLTVGMGALVFALYFSLCLGLLAAAMIDLDFMILPDSITLSGLALGLLTSPFRDEVTPISSALFSLLGFAGIWLPFIWGYQKLRGVPGMGLGDAKLLALAGAWFGGVGILFTLFAGAIQGTAAAIVVVLAKGKIDEPEAVKKERDELLQAIDEAEGAEREELLAILRDDPVGTEPGDGLLSARIPFGPFLVLALIELCLFFEPIGVWINEWFYL